MPFDSSKEGRWLMNQWLAGFRPALAQQAKALLLNGFQQQMIRDPLGLNFPMAFPGEDEVAINEDIFRGKRPLLLVPNREGGALDTDNDGGPLWTSGGPGPGATSGTSGAPATTTATDPAPGSTAVTEPSTTETEPPPATPMSPGSSYEYVTEANTWVIPSRDCSAGDTLECANLFGAAYNTIGLTPEDGLACFGYTAGCGFCAAMSAGGADLCSCCRYEEICNNCVDDPSNTCFDCLWLVITMCCYVGGLADFGVDNCCAEPDE